MSRLSANGESCPQTVNPFDNNPLTPMTSSNKDHTQLFARIRLHGLTKSSSGTACPIDLQRTTSLPMPALYNNGHYQNDDLDISSRVLAPRYDIEAKVCFDRPIVSERAGRNDFHASSSGTDGALGAGRAGIVYPLEILSFKHATSQTSDNEDLLPPNVLDASSEEPLEPPALPPLCVKVAKPHYARNLAREAWFYEQFDAKGLTGLIVPRCYGVFHTSNISDELTIDIPGYSYYRAASTPVSGSSNLYTACLPEEVYYDETNTLTVCAKKYMDDVKNSYSESEWTQFREIPEVQTVTVLIMDMLGDCMTIKDFEADGEGDLTDIFDDHLLPLDITHDDIRFPNLLKVPPHLQVPCPMHPNAIPGHKWNLTDWEEARKVSLINMGADLTIDQLPNLYTYYQQVGGKQTYGFDDVYTRVW